MEEQKKKIESKLKNEVTISKKSDLKKEIIKNDGKTIGKHMVFDVVIPSIKKMIFDATVGGLGLALFNDSRVSGRPNTTDYSKPYQQVSYRSYNQVYKPYEESIPQKKEVVDSNGFDYTSFVFSDRGDAELTISQMQDIIDEYGVATVSDLYDIVRKTSPYTAENYGWKSVASAKTTIGSNGFMIIWPKPMPLK